MPPIRTFRFAQKENGLHKQRPVSRRACCPVVGISLSHFRNCLDRGICNRGFRGWARTENRTIRVILENFRGFSKRLISTLHEAEPPPRAVSGRVQRAMKQARVVTALLIASLVEEFLAEAPLSAMAGTMTRRLTARGRAARAQ